MFKRLMVFFTGVTLTVVLAGCGGTAVAELPEVTADEIDSTAVLNVLNTAETIQLDKAVFSFGDSWTVKVNDTEVAELKGQVIPVFGDTYSMFSTNGNLVGSEAEEIMRLLPGATLYDYNNVERGGINQELTLFLQSYTVEDIEGNILGTAEQQFSLTLDFEVKNANGDVEYRVQKAFFSWGASLTITRMVDTPQVEAQDVIWLAVIINELNEAKDEENNNNNK